MASLTDSRTQSTSSAPLPATDELLLSLIEQMKQSDSKISAFIDNQQRINDDITRSDLRISAFIESQQRTNDVINSKLDQINSLSETVASNTQRISSLELENAALKRELQDLKATHLGRQDCNDNEIIVSGLPEPLSVGPSVAALNMLAVLDASSISPHVLNVRAVRKSPPGSSSSQTNAATGNSLIITVTSSTVRDLIISKKRTKGTIRQGEICGNDSKSFVYINEMLSKDSYELLQQTKRVAKERSYRYVWVKGGRIHVRHSDGKPVIRIDSHADLDKLV
ncbi:uncharacterized protein LOC112460227 [Temnothorax curvispinosus]|uniref:Uncharacterized protein LOC112460227 n=1 Tax=Temnothorax curvispinosus TaxID=300111 RepID=A0A6J1QFL3_9HYME|nr:uncharacterized protein LOC112460227 [Temnothorax curvispinosus]